MLRLVLAGFLVALFAEKASACSCRRFSADDFYSRARAIFVGEITQISVVKSSDGGDIARAKFRVDEVVKGNPDLISFIESGVPRGPTCDLYLNEGRSYLFVLFDTNFVTWCDSGPVTSEPYREWLVEYRNLIA